MSALRPQYQKKTNEKLEAKDVLPNTNRMQAVERAKNAVFVPGDLDLDLQITPSEGQNTTSL